VVCGTTSASVAILGGGGGAVQMHSVASRANTILTFAISVLAAFAGMNACSMVLFNAEPAVTLSRTSAAWERGYDKVDEAQITLDLEYDVRTVFNWNVKQIFMWVAAEYTTNGTESGLPNEVVLWDKIITRDSKFVDAERGILSEYHLREDRCVVEMKRSSGYYPDNCKRFIDLRDKSVQLRVSWSVMPITGYLWVYKGKSEPFRLPDTASRPHTPSRFARFGY